MKRDNNHQRIQHGFIKLVRSAYTSDLLRDPFAFALLTIIALRAVWRSGLNIHDLQPGEALIGDYKNYWMTRREYRTRLERLATWGLITIRARRRGTIAKLTSTTVFNINIAPNEFPTNLQSAKNRPAKRPALFQDENGSERPMPRPTKGQQEASN